MLSLYPLVWCVQMSLCSGTFGAKMEFVGLRNYFRICKDPSFWHSLKITFTLVFVSLFLQLSLGSGIAFLLHGRVKTGGLLLGLLTIPMVMADSMVGLTWRLYYAERGIFNYITQRLLGFKIFWHTSSYALPAVIIGEVWRWTPFFVLVLLAGLKSLPKELLEAAAVDGASRFQAFRRVTLPLLIPLIVIASILRFIDAMKLFGMVFAMYGGGPGSATETLPISIYITTLRAKDIPMGMTESVLLTLFITVLGVVYVLLYKYVRARGTVE